MSEAPEETTQEPEPQEQDGPEPEPDLTVSEPSEEEREGEEVEGQEGEPEQSQEASGAAGAVGEKELEKMFKKVETANLAYVKRLEGIMGEEIGVLEPCPRCGDPFVGLIFPPLMRPASPEVKAAVLLSVGEEPPSVSEPDPYSRRCDACKGWGRVLSGSRLNQQKTLQCIPCNGRGWVAVGDERRVPQQAVAAPVTPNGAEGPVEQPPNADPWGRGPNDPDYGRLPNFVGTN